MKMCVLVRNQSINQLINYHLLHIYIAKQFYRQFHFVCAFNLKMCILMHFILKRAFLYAF